MVQLANAQLTVLASTGSAIGAGKVTIEVNARGAFDGVARAGESQTLSKDWPASGSIVGRAGYDRNKPN